MSVLIPLMRGAFMICTVMYGSGVKIGMGDIRQGLKPTRLAQPRAMSVSCAGAAGTTTPGAAAPPSASGSGPATASSTTASASLAPHYPSGRFATRTSCSVDMDRVIKGRSIVASGGEATPKRSEGVSGAKASDASDRNFTMKRIGKIFEEIVDYDNLRLAFWKASRGKRSRDDQISFGRNLDDELARLRDGLRNLNYFIGDFKRFTIYDPKEREICAATFGERVLHHAIMNVCESYFDKWLIYDSYACRKGKGQIAAVKRAREFAGKYTWFMKCDFRKYFDSIPHDRLKFALARKFKDRKVLDWFYKIIDSYEKTKGRGLPIGYG